MPSLYCLRCGWPVFRIISDAVDEYCCLRLFCENFKLSVRRSATGIDMDSDSDAVSETERHPLPESRSDHPAVAVPISQPYIHQRPGAGQQYATASAAEPNRIEPPAGRSNGVVKREHKDCMRILQKPLSEHVTNGEDLIAVTLAWVNRSAEQRRGELLPNQRVKKPQNAYFLYTQTYADAAEKLIRSPNRLSWPITVAIIAQSWRMESRSVRAQFFGLAATETMMHKQAFPGYKGPVKRTSAKDEKE